MSPKRRFLVPEVVQTSGMDCGPASLKCLLEGFGISVSYGRLREACQTDVDGTSIETLEGVARQLGLDAEQIMIPSDHLRLAEVEVFPAIVVVRLPNGFTHFVVAWRRLGPFVQIMDPGSGRRWVSCESFYREVYEHSMAVPAEGWRDWAGQSENGQALTERLQRLNLAAEQIDELLAAAQADPFWLGYGCLDAALRLVQSLVSSGAFQRGSESASLLSRLFAARSQPDQLLDLIPRNFWSVWPDPEEPDQLHYSGAVLVRVRGHLTSESLAQAREETPLSPELVQALAEEPDRPLALVWRLLVADGLLAPTLMIAAILFSGIAALAEAVVLRAVLDLTGLLGLGWQRLAGVGLLLLFFSLITALHFPTFRIIMRLGRHLEVRLRETFLVKVPLIGDRYFQSRPRSDMADRLHRIVEIRKVPLLVARLVLGIAEMSACTLALIWLDPSASGLILLLALASVSMPLLFQPVLTGVDMRVRAHLGGLSRFYLDGLLGLSPLRAHGAEPAMRSQHERLVVEWVRARRQLIGLNTLSDGLRMLVATSLVVSLVFGFFGAGNPLTHSLLFVYWATRLPLLGQFTADLIRQYPGQRNLSLRLLEPLGAAEEAVPSATGPTAGLTEHTLGVALELADVSVVASGQVILQNLQLEINPGEHVAIVGPSGAGKSSLLGLLLGWYRPTSGQLQVDGRHLDGETLALLREQLVWVDPAIQLWNRSLLYNLHYGSRGAPALSEVLVQADLLELLEKMPDGLQTCLGEGGALVSGGEGQRVRLGRAMLRGQARCVLLDEPFRGLDRETRQRLMQRARAFWQDATLLCVTHDISETQSFDRVLVIEDGRLVEDGPPHQLAQTPSSAFARLLHADREAYERVWRDPHWRRLFLDHGALQERDGEPEHV